MSSRRLGASEFGIRDGQSPLEQTLCFALVAGCAGMVHGRRRRGRSLAECRINDERDGAEALQEDAEGAGGEAVGDLVFKEGLEEGEHVAGKLLERVFKDIAAEAAPAGEPVPQIEVGAGLAGGSVVAAEGVTAGGHATALVSAGQSEDAFGGHGISGRW